MYVVKIGSGEAEINNISERKLGIKIEPMESNCFETAFPDVFYICINISFDC